MSVSLSVVNVSSVFERRVSAPGARPTEAAGQAEEAQLGPDRAVLEHAENAGGPACRHRRRRPRPPPVGGGRETRPGIVSAAAVERGRGHAVGHAGEEVDEAGNEQVQLCFSVDKRLLPCFSL